MLAQVGRADLLRALSLGRMGALALEHTDAVWWGYVLPEPDATMVEDAGQTLAWPFRAPEPPVASTPGPMRARSALRMPEAWVAERRDHDRADELDTSHLPTLLATNELQPLDEPRAAYQDLLPLPRLARPLAAQLRQSQAAGVNVAALLHASTRRQWPRRLPRLTRQSWPATLVLMLDVSTDLFPYRYDMYRVASLLQALVPRAQMRLMAGAHGPFGPWHVLHGPRTRCDADDGMRPQPGCTYLLLSDLGLLRSASDMAQAWNAWLARAQARQCTCVALAPVGEQDVSATLAARVRLLRWSPDSRLQPERGLPESEVATAGSSSDHALRELLACLSATLRVDPPLLRTLRQTGSAPQDASLEGRMWAHPDVLSTTYASLRRARVASQQTELLLPSAARWSALKKVCAFHHHHWPLGMRLVEGMHQLAASPQPETTLLDQLRQDLARLAHSVQRGQGDRDALDATVDYVLQRAPHQAQTHLRGALDALAQATGRPTGPRQRWCLLQRGEQLHIAPATDVRPPGAGAVLCSDLGQAAPGELISIGQRGRIPQYLRLPAQGMLALPVTAAGAEILLGGEETRLLRRQRTRGVWGWRQSDGSVIETLDLPWSKDLSFPNEGLIRGFALLPDRRGADVRVSVDHDEYGVYLEILPLTLAGKGFGAKMRLRFRYLEPATFLQGSPEGTGRSDEHPQHPVTLSQGLWLAETPCTQALWQALMGKNPSHFKQGEDAPKRPVENVSLDDVHNFVKALQWLLPPGCEVVLPTESQWEYACRAGTQTQYWWGDAPDESKANFNMTGQRQWEDKDGTTPVDRYPANPWGLYDMHGNVLELCADGQREYADAPARDPDGPGYGDERMARGGSWFFRPLAARAAYRSGGVSGHAFRYRGFRVALRSPSGPEARPGWLGASRRGVAAGGRTVGVDTPTAEPPPRDADDGSTPE